MHLHAHCLVTGGGLSTAGQWVPVKNGYLLPGKVVRDLFRGKFIAGMRRALETGRLSLPQGMTEQKVRNLLNKLGRKKWNVCVRERYRHGRGVVTYLARYIKGGPISNQRLVCADEAGVRFRYRDHRDGKAKEMTLGVGEFIQRLLWHVPEKGMQVVRHYGLYGRGGQKLREKCRSQLGQPAEEKATVLTWQSYWERVGHGDKVCCPVCGERLIYVRRVPPGVSPPEVGSGHRQAA
ncbi:MAG: transposase [Candidatus Binatia bacterium]